MNNKVAILGGSFNPPTISHFQICKKLIEQGMNEVWIVPCDNHRFKNNLIDFKDRFEMCKFFESDKIKVKDLERSQKFGGKVFDLMTYLTKTNNNDTFYFVIGADILMEIHKWYKYEYLINNFQFIVFDRNNFINSSVDKDYILNNLNKFKNYILVEDYIEPYSSTLIRDKIKNNQEINKFLIPQVEQYILKRRLYV